jgi:hypothetical protein
MIFMLRFAEMISGMNLVNPVPVNSVSLVNEWAAGKHTLHRHKSPHQVDTLVLAQVGLFFPVPICSGAKNMAL